MMINKLFNHSHSLRSEELIVATKDGWLHRLAWNGKMNSQLAINIRCVRFSADLETTTGSFLILRLYSNHGKFSYSLNLV